MSEGQWGDVRVADLFRQAKECGAGHITLAVRQEDGGLLALCVVALGETADWLEEALEELQETLE